MLYLSQLLVLELPISKNNEIKNKHHYNLDFMPFLNLDYRLLSQVIT